VPPQAAPHPRAECAGTTGVALHATPLAVRARATQQRSTPGGEGNIRERVGVREREAEWVSERGWVREREAEWVSERGSVREREAEWVRMLD
jgi:hypothetical protein